MGFESALIEKDKEIQRIGALNENIDTIKKRNEV